MKHEHHAHAQAAAGATKPAPAYTGIAPGTIYTCPMHPQIRQVGPGNAIALVTGHVLTSPALMTAALSLGLVGYGLSLVLFILSLRALGAARTGAYFATAPFIGAAFAFAVLREPLSASLLLGGVLMLIGVVLHVTEEHSHEHEHEALTHAHAHVHDEHHQHEHDFPWLADKAHAHEHTHPPIRHRHPHYPDLHHQHTH